jgi:hypothetical protein
MLKKLYFCSTRLFQTEYKSILCLRVFLYPINSNFVLYFLSKNLDFLELNEINYKNSDNNGIYNEFFSSY